MKKYEVIKIVRGSTHNVVPFEHTNTAHME